MAVIGARADPGRRRWTATRELGHHLMLDEYHSDIGVATSRDARERLIDRFAGEFLLPEQDLREAWQGGEPARSVLVRLAGCYRLSWSAVVRLALRHGLLTNDEERRLRADTPVLGDFLAVCGAGPRPDLELGATGRQWHRAVLAAWNSGAITGPRAVELLYGTIGVDDLPPRTTADEAA